VHRANINFLGVEVSTGHLTKSNDARDDISALLLYTYPIPNVITALQAATQDESLHEPTYSSVCYMFAYRLNSDYLRTLHSVHVHVPFRYRYDGAKRIDCTKATIVKALGVIQLVKLETVNFDRGGRNTLLGEEGGDLLALVALKLNDLPHLLVVDERAVACELLDVDDHTISHSSIPSST
jgi:hypothetical protein